MEIIEKLSTYWPDIEPGSLCRFNEVFLKRYEREIHVHRGPGLKPFKREGNFYYELKNYDWNYLLNWKERPHIFIKVVNAYYHRHEYDTVFICLDGTYFSLSHWGIKNYRELIKEIT